MSADTKHTEEPKRRQLFYGFEPKEGEPTQYVGCYILKWDFAAMGQPTIAFVEADDDEAERAAACVNALKGLNPSAVPEVIRAAHDFLTHIAYSSLDWAAKYGDTVDPSEVLVSKGKAYDAAYTALAAAKKVEGE